MKNAHMPRYDVYSSQDVEEFGQDWGRFEKEAVTNDLDKQSPHSNDSYFHSYGYIGIHEEMLKDDVRTGSYFKAITTNKHLFQDQVVLDIGCGTGILSLFCIAAGAKHVYAIECSNIIHLAERIAKENGVSDRITFIHGKCEEVELPVPHVDIIVSEWMGYFLLYENMLESVIFCRDKWLKPGGLMFPDKARLHMAAIEDSDYKSDKLDTWRDTYGFNFSIMREYLIEEPLVDVVEEKAVNTTSCCVLSLDLHRCKIEDLDFSSEFLLVGQRKDYVHALVFWFDVTFSVCHKPLVLSTSPMEKYTHWKQTVFYLPDDLMLDHGDNIKGMVAVRRNGQNRRDIDVKIHYNHQGDGFTIKNTRFYRIR